MSQYQGGQQPLSNSRVGTLGSSAGVGQYGQPPQQQQPGVGQYGYPQQPGVGQYGQPQAPPPPQPGYYGAPPQQPGVGVGQYGYPQQPQYGYQPATPGVGQYGPPQPQPGYYGAPQQQPQYGYPQQPPSQYGQPLPPPSGQDLMSFGKPVQQNAQYNYAAGASTTPYYPLPYMTQYVTQYPLSPSFNASNDCEQLKRAFKGLGTDEATVIRILGNRNLTERQAIKTTYNQKYGKTLEKALQSETSGNFLLALSSLMYDPLDYDVNELYKSMKGLGTNEQTLIEILVTRSNQQKQQIKLRFANTHTKSLEGWIVSDTSGYFKDFLIALLSPRAEITTFNHYEVENDSNKLYYAGEGKLGTDEKVFIEIFTKRSFAHMHELIKVYERSHKKHTLERAVRDEFSGHLRTGLLAIINYTLDPIGYFAECLYESMVGAGTRDRALVRGIVSQLHQIPLIKQKYVSKYGKDLSTDIVGDTSGDYKKLLIELIK